MLVMKFGGSILRDAHDFQMVADYLKGSFEEERIIAVVSALKGVTDQLLKVGELAASGKESEASETLHLLRERHLSVCRELGLSCSDVTKELEKLEKVIAGVTYIGEITPRIMDLIASTGENLSGNILAEMMEGKGVKAKFLTGGEAGIITDDSYGEANPLLKATGAYLKRRLLPMLEQGALPVVAGFSGLSQRGKVTTLGRGGSDLTAVLIGSSLGAREVWLWTDVDGLMTADPRIVEDARLIKHLSYREAIELAYFGAKRMHPRFLEPAMMTSTPVRIRNFHNRSSTGTLISSREVRSREVVKAIGLRKEVSIITVRGVGMVGRPGTAGKLFSLLGDNRLNVLMISQSVSESDISMVLESEDAERARVLIETKLLGPIFREVLLDRGCSVVAVIGSGMRGTPGVASRVFRAVSYRGINVKMIAQGSSEVNISFVVDEVDGEEAVKALHEEFGLGRDVQA